MNDAMTNLAARLTELETRLVFQDQTIDDLHKEVYRQQGQLDELALELAKLKIRLAQDSPGGGGNSDAGG